MQTAGYALAMRTAAILPVKHFAQAKQRLGASVADPLRLELTRAMVGDVLAALSETTLIETRFARSSSLTTCCCRLSCRFLLWTSAKTFPTT